MYFVQKQHGWFVVKILKLLGLGNKLSNLRDTRADRTQLLEVRTTRLPAGTQRMTDVQLAEESAVRSLASGPFLVSARFCPKTPAIAVGLNLAAKGISTTREV